MTFIKANDEEALALVGADLPIESEQESSMGNTFYLPYHRFQLKDGKHIGSTSSSNRRLFSSPALSRMEALFESELFALEKDSSDLPDPDKNTKTTSIFGVHELSQGW